MDENRKFFITNTGDTLVGGEWFHLAVTRSGDDVTIYVNGVNRATTTAAGGIDTSILSWCYLSYNLI